ncbi:MAG: sulfatase-like hydrolase/transferase, partial [Synergistaceae bacterium]|nr:sulfatase-like hydrolase/transferase [Synergistaceae bacterium]
MRKIFDSLIKAKNFIFWTAALNLTLAVYKYISGGALQAICAAFAVLLSVIILNLVLDLIKFKNLNKILKFVIIVLSAGMFLLDMFALHYYKCRFDAGMLDVIFGTKPAETFEFLNEYVFNLSLIKFFALSFIVIYILYLIYKRLAVFKIFWALSLILVIALTPFYERSQFNGFAKKCISPFNLFDMLYDVYRENKIFNEMLSKSKREIKFTKNNSSINNFIFILGESTSRNHMSLYNYNLNTTPLLNSRRANGELYVFNNALSPNSHTIPVMEKLFTFYDNKAKGKWYEYTSLFSILNEAGYKTFWLSNQETFGKYSRAGKFYASQGGISQFVMVRDSFTSNTAESYDGNLLKILDNNLNNLNSKNFYVLHIMGTHSKYAMRYPEEFNKFKAQDEVTGYNG